MMVRKTAKELFDRVIASLRQAVHEMEDFRLSVRLAAAIASVTKTEQDIRLAIHKAAEHGNHSLRAEALAIVAKTLAEAGHIAQARSVACEMLGLDAYWIAEARIWIARFSGKAEDKQIAKNAISHINMPYLKNEASADLDSLLKRHHHTGQQKEGKHLSDFKALQAILSELKGFEDRHAIKPRFTSAHLRLKASEIIDRLFAEAMK